MNKLLNMRNAVSEYCAGYENGVKMYRDFGAAPLPHEVIENPWPRALGFTDGWYGHRQMCFTVCPECGAETIDNLPLRDGIDDVEFSQRCVSETCDWGT